MRTKHRLHLLWFGLFWMLLTASCGAAEVAAQPPTPVTLRWVDWETNSAVEHAWLTQFQTDAPQIHVKQEGQDNWPQFYLTQAQPPNLMMLDVSDALGEAIQKNQVADLTEIWTESQFDAAYPAPLAALSAANGQQYILPVAYSWEAIYYNKAVFAQVGLTPPETWEEFLSLCDTLLANGVTPLALAGGDGYTGLMWFEYLDLRLNGPKFHRALLAGQVHFDDARVRTVVETWRDLFVRGYYVETARTLSDANSINTLIRGDKGMLGKQKTAMALVDTYAMRNLPPAFQAELDFFRFPIIDRARPVVEAIDVIGYLAPAKADHLPETLTFLSYLASAKAQRVVAQNKFLGDSLFAPARTDIDPGLLAPAQRQALALVQTADDVVLPLGYAVPYAVWTKFNYAYQSFTDEPHDVERFLQKMEEARQEAVAKGLLPG